MATEYNGTIKLKNRLVAKAESEGGKRKLQEKHPNSQESRIKSSLNVVVTA